VKWPVHAGNPALCPVPPCPSTCCHRYFGEDPATTPSDEFFAIWADFTKLYGRAVAKAAEDAERKARAEQRERDKAAKAAASAASASASPAGGAKGPSAQSLTARSVRVSVCGKGGGGSSCAHNTHCLLPPPLPRCDRELHLPVVHLRARQPSR